MAPDPHARPPHRCRRPLCPWPAEKDGLCARHRRPWSRESGGGERSRLPADWRERRLAVLERDGYRCQLQLPGCLGRATEVHHAGDRTDHRLEVLTSTCRACHAKETARRARAGRGTG